MVIKAPVVPVLQRVFHKWSKQRQRLILQTLIFILTYLSYMSYHAAKRPFSVLKSVFSPDCEVSNTFNNTCHPWPPFEKKKTARYLFGLLDFTFLMTYALAMSVTGYIADQTNLRIFLAIGMLLTGILTSCLGLAYYFQIHSLMFFIVFFVLTGITQATGFPCAVECIGMWFPKGCRGLIMGVWSTHSFIGNIVGGAIAGVFATNEWALSFIVPGTIVVVLGIINFFLLIPDPAHIDIVIENPKENNSQDVIKGDLDPSDNNSNDQSNRTSEKNAIGIISALKIPGVIEYSLFNFFAKLVGYTFLFWLPYYIKVTPIEGSHVNASQAAYLSILFDVGAAVGGIIAGQFADYTKSPSTVNVIMLFIAAPLLFVFKTYASINYTSFIILNFISGSFISGPCILLAAISANLGSHDCLQGNYKAMAVVASIIDATGSLGAAVGPLLAGIIASKYSWASVFYMLIGCELVAALMLSRQFVEETKARYLKDKRDDHAVDHTETESLLKGGD